MSGQRLAHFLRNSVQSRNWMTVGRKGAGGRGLGDVHPPFFLCLDKSNARASLRNTCVVYGGPVWTAEGIKRTEKYDRRDQLPQRYTKHRRTYSNKQHLEEKEAEKEAEEEEEEGGRRRKKKEEGRREKEEGRRKKKEERRKKKEERRKKKEERRKKKEERRKKKEERRKKKEERRKKGKRWRRWWWRRICWTWRWTNSKERRTKQQNTDNFLKKHLFKSQAKTFRKTNGTNGSSEVREAQEPRKVVEMVLREATSLRFSFRAEKRN